MRNTYFFVLFICLIPTLLFGKECFVNVTSQDNGDCVQCAKEPATPGDKVAGMIKPFLNHVSESKEQKQKIDRFKGYLLFLKDPLNKKSCENYPQALLKYTTDFQKEFGDCQKGIDLFEKKKYICEWVLNTFNDQMVDSIFGYWTTKNAKGELVNIKGKSIEQIDGFVRAQAAWCNRMQKSYKSKIYISCGDLNRWVGDLNITKTVGEAMKRDMAQSNEPPPLSPEEEQKRLFDQGCKYFDKNPGTNFTKDLYMACVTR